jgi:hypothetical protein
MPPSHLRLRGDCEYLRTYLPALCRPPVIIGAFFINSQLHEKGGRLVSLSRDMYRPVWWWEGTTRGNYRQSPRSIAWASPPTLQIFRRT